MASFLIVTLSQAHSAAAPRIENSTNNIETRKLGESVGGTNCSNVLQVVGEEDSQASAKFQTEILCSAGLPPTDRRCFCSFLPFKNNFK